MTDHDEESERCKSFPADDSLLIILNRGISPPLPTVHELLHFYYHYLA